MIHASLLTKRANFQNDKLNNDILWILSDKGVLGYIIYEVYTPTGDLTVSFQPINDDFYFDNISFHKENKIRVDYQNNVWITSNEGLYLLRYEHLLFFLVRKDFFLEN